MKPSPLTIALCLSIALLEGFDIQAMGVVAAKLAAELQLAPGQMGWVFAATNMGILLGAAISGWFADRAGRKPVLLASVLLFGIFTLATTAAADAAPLLAVRFCTGLGFGGALPIIMALAVDISTPSRRASTAAAIFIGLPLGGGLSALLTQGLPPDFDWRLLFYIGGALPLLLAPALLAFMRETYRRTERGAHHSSWSALFGGRRARPTLLIWLALFPTLLMLYLILNWLPTLVIAKGLDRAAAPQAAMAFNLSSIVGALLFGALVDRFGSRWPLGIGYLGVIAAFDDVGKRTRVRTPPRLQRHDRLFPARIELRPQWRGRILLSQ